MKMKAKLLTVKQLRKELCELIGVKFTGNYVKMNTESMNAIVQTIQQDEENDICFDINKNSNITSQSSWCQDCRWNKICGNSSL